MNNIMIDIETLGTESFSLILSLAAVEFDIETGKIGREFYKKIELQSALDVGLKIDTETLTWWMQQKPEALQEMFKDAEPITKVLNSFRDWIAGPDVILWGNSARFDLGLLQNAFNAINCKIPWNWYNERCVRTLSSLYPNIKKGLTFEGEKHNALHDCYHQIKYCNLIYKSVISS